MPSKLKKPNQKRAASFIPQVITHLETKGKFECLFSDLPKSYQAQPYNIPSKILERGGIMTKVIMNQSTNVYIIVKI